MLKILNVPVALQVFGYLVTLAGSLIAVQAVRLKFGGPAGGVKPQRFPLASQPSTESTATNIPLV